MAKALFLEDLPIIGKYVRDLLANKVDKVEGKSLSTNDYTTEEKTKLEALSNDYDDLTDKPSINDVTLTGNKTTEDLIPIGNGLGFNADGELEATGGSDEIVIPASFYDLNGRNIVFDQGVTISQAKTIICNAAKNRKNVVVVVSGLINSGERHTESHMYEMTYFKGSEDYSRFYGANFSMVETEFLNGDIYRYVRSFYLNQYHNDSDTIKDSIYFLRDIEYNAPSQGSADLISSGAVYSALQNVEGTTDYTDLENQPQVNGVTLTGNKTSADLGLMPIRNIDLIPRDGSKNFIFSGGVYEADEKIKSSIEGMDTVYTEDGTPVDLPTYDVIQEMEMYFKPTQDLHGYDKPWAGGAGKNKLPYFTAEENNGIRLTYDDGVAVLDGTSSANAFFTLSNLNLTSNNYVFSANNDTANSGVHISLREIGASSDFADLPINDTDKHNYYQNVSIGQVTLYVLSGTQLTNFRLPLQIEVGSEKTDFEPYSNICPISGQDNATLTDEYDNKYIASLGGTYYGGRVYFENSGFIETIKSVSMSSLTWQRSRSGGFAAEISDAEIGKKFLACSILNPLEESFSWTNFDNYPDNSISYSGGEGTGNKNVYVKCMSCDTLEEFQTLIANQQLAYKLFTAITHRISVTREPLSRGEITYNGSALYISYQKDNVIGECKKFTVDEIAKNKPFNYSTTEQVVGTWIDGKPVYQKVIQVSNLAIKSSESYVDLQTSDVDIIASSEVKFAYGDGNKFSSEHLLGTQRGYLCPYVDSTAHTALIAYKTTDVLYDVIVTMRYTKTTD